ncbi:hypothetical protein GBF38_006583 [Nibea albiflora]|uniref:Uncharacterized protein n=1 Tax=Nibea albiflora TaxID=240163 RepID=A0ACB7EGW7_NIBAL|nr:hypothetical protein GBF38_006583 [Nibea albiflora]
MKNEIQSSNNVWSDCCCWTLHCFCSLPLNAQSLFSRPVDFTVTASHIYVVCEVCSGFSLMSRTTTTNISGPNTDTDPALGPQWGDSCKERPMKYSSCRSAVRLSVRSCRRRETRWRGQKFFREQIDLVANAEHLHGSLKEKEEDIDDLHEENRQLRQQLESRVAAEHQTEVQDCGGDGAREARASTGEHLLQGGRNLPHGRGLRSSSLLPRGAGEERQRKEQLLTP